MPLLTFLSALFVFLRRAFLQQFGQLRPRFGGQFGVQLDEMPVIGGQQPGFRRNGLNTLLQALQTECGIRGRAAQKKKIAHSRPEKEWIG